MRRADNGSHIQSLVRIEKVKSGREAESATAQHVASVDDSSNYGIHRVRIIKALQVDLAVTCQCALRLLRSPFPVSGGRLCS